MKSVSIDADGVLKRRAKHVIIKGPLGAVYADYRDSGKQVVGGEAPESHRKAFKRSSAVALTTGWEAIETGRSALTSAVTTVGADVVRLFQGDASNSTQEALTPGPTSVRTLEARALKPIHYGDLLMLSADIDSDLDDDRRRGLFSADPSIGNRCRLCLFSEISEIESIGLCVFQIVPPGCCEPGGDTTDNKRFGEILRYGKPFVLRCWLYGSKCLQHEDGKHADIEKNFDRMGISSTALSNCIFTVSPKFQSRAKDCVYYGDDILIASSIKGYFVHAGGLNSAFGVGSDGYALQSRIELEVNFARLKEIESGACIFQAVEYASFNDISPQYLSAGSAIRLYQPELEAYLVTTCSTSPSQVFDGPRRRHNSVIINTNSSILEIDPPVFSYNTRNLSGEPHDFTEDIMGTGIFVIEKMSPLIGGSLEWGEPVRFRHVASNSYLSANRAAYYTQSEAAFKVPFGASLCRVIDESDKAAQNQFLQDTLFYLESASRIGDESDRRMKFPLTAVRIKHIYQQSMYDIKSNKAKERPESSKLPYFMRVRRRFESEVRKMRSDIFDATAKESVVETILSFGDDVVLRIPQYPEVIASGTNDADSEVERAQRVSELADKYTIVSKVAMFIDDINDADVMQLIPVPARDYAYADCGCELVRICHNFEVSLLLMAEKMKSGVRYNIPRDIFLIVNSGLDHMRLYASTEEISFEASELKDEKVEESENKLQTAYDKEVAVRRQQMHIMDSGLLDRLFWLFRAPVYLNITWPVVYQNRQLLNIFQKLKMAISSICQNNPLVQEYVAHSSYLGSRAESAEATGDSTSSIGYASEIFSHLFVDEEGASRMLEAALSCNRELLSALFDEDVIEAIVDLIQLKGAKPSLLRLLGSMANADSKPMFPNQKLLLDLMYSLRDDQRYIHNRRRLLMETGCSIDSRSITYGKGCSDSITIDQHDLCVLWYGVADRSEVKALFQSAKSMGMDSACVNEASVAVSKHLSDYFAQVDCHKSERDWVSLQAIAWCIDPFNCFEFSKPGVYSRAAWAKRLIELKADQKKVKKFKLMQKVVSYYGAILDFFERMTANRSYESINIIEEQFTTDLLFSGLGNEDLPLYFRYRFGALLRNIYIDRFPHRDLNLPDYIRVPERIKEVGSFESVLPKYACCRIPSVNALGEITFPEPEEGFMHDTSLTKFQRVQSIIGEYFLGSTFSLIVSPRQELGSLLPQSPASRLGASEKDSYRFSYLLLEIMHLLVRRGFYHTECQLLQAIHVAYGVLTSHVYTETAFVRESTGFVATTFDHNDNIKSSTSYEKLPIEESPIDEGGPVKGSTVEMVAPMPTTPYYSPIDILPFGGFVVSKVKNRINQLTSSDSQVAVEEHKALVMSDDLCKLCARHSLAMAAELGQAAGSMRSNNKTIVVFENQRYAVKWVPLISAHRDKFHSEDEYVRALFTKTTPEESPDHEGGLPPDGLWKWVDRWHVNPDAGGDVVSLDPEGWVYAFAWPRSKKDFSPIVNANSFVRRRKWERTREMKSAAEFAHILFQKDISEPIILAAYKRNMNSAGVVNLSEVLKSIKEISEIERKKSRLLETAKAVHFESDHAVGLEEDPTTNLEGEKLILQYSKHCVLEALGLLSYVYVIATDARVTSFFSIIRESITSNSPLWETITSLDPGFYSDTIHLTTRGKQKTEDLFIGKTAALDCVKLSDGKCVEKFMSFVMSDDHSVCELALTVLREHFQQVQSFSDQMCNLIFCSGDYLYYNYLLCRSLVSRMTPHLDMYWIREDVAAMSEKLIEIFDQLTNAISSDACVGICWKLQNIVGAMKAHEFALKTLHNDIVGYKTMCENQKECSKPLWKSICSFLCAFTKANEKNISEVMKSFMSGAHGIGMGFGGVDFIITLFLAMSTSHTRALDHISGQKIYIAIFEELSERLYDIPNLHEYTGLLMRTLFQCRNIYEVLNQNFLIRTMLSKRYRSLLLLYLDDDEAVTSRHSVAFQSSRSRAITDDGGSYMAEINVAMAGSGYIERKNLMKQFSELSPSSQKPDSGVYFSKLVYYHAACVELLAHCTGGRNLGNISKCSQLFTFETVAAVLLEINSCRCFPILKAFSIFMVNVYIFSTESSQEDSMTESPVLCDIICLFCSVVKSTAPPEQWKQREEIEGLRDFLLNGAVVLFSAYFSIEVENVDVRRADLATVVQDLIRYLQDLPKDAFTDGEWRQVEDIALSFGMPISAHFSAASNSTSIIEEPKFEVTNPLKSKKSAYHKMPSTIASRTTDTAADGLTWGDSEIRFQEVYLLCVTCPFMAELRDNELNRFVDFMLKNYYMSSESDYGDSVVDINEALLEKNSDKLSSRGDDKRQKSSDTMPLSSRSKSAKNTNDAKGNFASIVSRLIKFAREEVDVIISKDDFMSTNVAKESLDKIRRANKSTGLFSAGSELEDLSPDSKSKQWKLVAGSNSISKNIPFIFKVLSRCTGRFVKKAEQEQEANKAANASIFTETAVLCPAIELSDVQELFAGAMAPSLVAEVIGGCRHIAVISAAVELGIQILANGNRKSQDAFIWHFKTIEPSKASKFFSMFSHVMLMTANTFASIRRFRVESSIKYSEREMKTVSPADAFKASKELLETTCVDQMIEFLRLLNEGHNLQIQSIMESQTSLGLKESSHLLSSAVTLLEAYLPSVSSVDLLTKIDAGLVLRVFSFLAEVVQGPCFENQLILVHSPIPALVQRLLDFSGHVGHRSDIKGTNTWRGKYGLDPKTLKELRVGGLQLLLSLLEGRQPEQSSPDPVYAELCALFDYEMIPRKLADILEEKSSAVSVLRRKFVSPEMIQEVENNIMEEGFLLLSLGRELGAHSRQIAKDIVPVLPPPVKKSRYATVAESLEAERERREMERIVKAFVVFENRLRSVEIAWGSLGLFKFNFILPQECGCLTEETKKNIIRNIEFGDEDRVKHFVQQTSSIHDDVSHQQTLRNKRVFVLLMRFQDELDYATAFVAMCICFILTISLEKGYFTGHDNPVYEPRSFQAVVQALVIIQLAILLYKLVQTSILTLPLIWKQSERMCNELRILQGKSSFDATKGVNDLLVSFGPVAVATALSTAVWYVIRKRFERVPAAIIVLLAVIIGNYLVRALDSLAKSSWNPRMVHASKLMTLAACMDHGELQYRVACVIVGILALDVNQPYYSSLLLLVIVKLSITLQNVVKAVTLPRVALFLSSVLGLIMIFIFAIFAFYFFPQEFYNEDQFTDECSTMLRCLTTFLHGGLLSGGGIADHISGELGHPPRFADSEAYASRVTYDVFFFVIIIVLLLNIIFGIIIDTFGKLREDAAEKNRLQTEYCFICGLPKESFEVVSFEKKEKNVGSGYSSAFMAHIKTEHNMWDYIFFLIYLKSKDDNNYFGIESYVAEKLKIDDVSWIPRGKALSIPDNLEEEQHEAEERLIGNLRLMMEATQKAISIEIIEQTSRLQEENRTLRDQVNIALKSVSNLQETLEEVKSVQASLEEAFLSQQKK